MKPVTNIAWECPACGNRHLWQWEHDEASPGEIIMICDNCPQETRTELVRIARNVWAAIFPGKG